jgi:hypothetical protein
VPKRQNLTYQVPLPASVGVAWTWEGSRTHTHSGGFPELLPLELPAVTGAAPCPSQAADISPVAFPEEFASDPVGLAQPAA